MNMSLRKKVEKVESMSIKEVEQMKHDEAEQLSGELMFEYFALEGCSLDNDFTEEEIQIIEADMSRLKKASLKVEYHGITKFM